MCKEAEKLFKNAEKSKNVLSSINITKLLSEKSPKVATSHAESSNKRLVHSTKKVYDLYNKLKTFDVKNYMLVSNILEKLNPEIKTGSDLINEQYPNIINKCINNLAPLLENFKSLELLFKSKKINDFPETENSDSVGQKLLDSIYENYDELRGVAKNLNNGQNKLLKVIDEVKKKYPKRTENIKKA